VGGDRFEVTPESGGPATVVSVSAKAAPRLASAPAAPAAAASASITSVTSLAGNTLTAPLPGTVISVFAKSGDQIETGQVLLVIEAMKMKNSIRSTRAGRIAQVLVSEGQTVAHKQSLLTFAEPGEASWM
jgi:biotin carboxyl carrier protein